MKSNRFVLVLVMFSVLSCVVLFGINGKNSKVEASSTKEKYYTSIRIEDGDSLWPIAEEYAAPGIDYKDFIMEVKQINSLSSDTINYGESLVIPQFK